ncbi:DUF6748 domain-containing protein [Chondromyces crocatus]|uniref:DUF6748 domain-containing protein n=1 Tax=Chondromyces crocatus TaxID=52 RepID=A0A0K1ETL7_CHOCO|nr:DUF6748 domain-containing protein [Chondromyces crocatus]AKT44129.1 uncharacterized protein CMC5_083690 [Chondromyces crocatus]
MLRALAIAVGFVSLLGIRGDAKAARERQDPAYYVVTAVDVRRCAQPHCGGYFIAKANKRLTECADGAVAASCYVATIDLSRLGLRMDEERALREGNVVFHGVMRPRKDVPRLRNLVVSDAFRAPREGSLSSTLFHVGSNGVQCVTYPCPDTEARIVNTTRTRTLDGVDLSGASGTERDKEAARRALLDERGLLVEGVEKVIPKAGPAGDATVIAARQFFLPVASHDEEDCQEAHQRVDAGDAGSVTEAPLSRCFGGVGDPCGSRGLLPCRPDLTCVGGRPETDIPGVCQP